MFDFGDELIIESYRIPWLIWIQLLVMVLLIILLYCMGNFSFDLSHHAATPAGAASSSAGTLLISTTAASATATGTATATANGSSSTVHSSMVGENQRGKEPGTSGSRVIAREEDIQERDRSSSKGATRATLSGHSHHPCHIFGLAKQAFLKCLGLGSTSESYSQREHRKEH